MNISVQKNGVELGPFSEEQVREMLKAEVLSPEDKARCHAIDKWQPLATFNFLEAARRAPLRERTPPILTLPSVPIKTGFTEHLPNVGLALVVISVLLVAVGVFKVIERGGRDTAKSDSAVVDVSPTSLPKKDLQELSVAELDALIKSAEQGNPDALRDLITCADHRIEAQYALAIAYAKGNGVSQDLEKAREWLLKCVGRGFVGGGAWEFFEAQSYDTKRGQAQTPGKAVQWYWMSACGGQAGAVNALVRHAEQGDFDAQFVLETCYWFFRSVNPYAREILMRYMNATSNVDGKLLSGAEAANSDSQFATLITSAEQGNSFAQYAVADAYSKGNVVARDAEMAVEWFLKSAQQGNADAMLDLGKAYARGYGVNKSDDIALSWLLKSAKQGNADAMLELAYAYNNRATYTALEHWFGRGSEYSVSDSAGADLWLANSVNCKNQEAAALYKDMAAAGAVGYHGPYYSSPSSIFLQKYEGRRVLPLRLFYHRRQKTTYQPVW